MRRLISATQQMRIYLNTSKWFKKSVIRVVFFVLGRAMQSAARHEPRIRRETAQWEEGFTLVLKVLPFGPQMGWVKENGRLKYKGAGVGQPDLCVNFKNVENAFLLMTPQIGLAQGFAEHRMSVVGDLARSVAFNRCVAILLGYLYPRILCKRLVKRAERFNLEQHMLRLRIYLLGIPFGM